jgi:hypothetical protein
MAVWCRIICCDAGQSQRRGSRRPRSALVSAHLKADAFDTGCKFLEPRALADELPLDDVGAPRGAEPSAESMMSRGPPGDRVSEVIARARAREAYGLLEPHSEPIGVTMRAMGPGRVYGGGRCGVRHAGVFCGWRLCRSCSNRCGSICRRARPRSLRSSTGRRSGTEP